MRKKVLLMAFPVLFLFSAYAAAEVIKLKFANYFPPMHMNSIVMGEYCIELNKKLAGKAEVTQYTGGTLLSAPKMAAGVASGIADIGLSNCSYTRGRFPVMEIMELPLGFPSSWVATHVANDFYDKFKPKEWDVYQVLMFSTSPPNVLQTVKPVKTLEEMKGMRIRSQGRLADIVKALGGTPLPIEIVDLYEALKRNVVEGSYIPLETLKGFKLGEIEKYVTGTWRIGSVFSFYVVMNKDKYDSLPPDVKKIILDFSKEFINRWAVEWNRIDIEGADYFNKQGGKILDISDTEAAKWIRSAEPVVADYKKDVVGKGYKPEEVETWIKYLQERIEYWKGREKTSKIPTAYKY